MQAARWCFTLNNYDATRDYSAHLRTVGFRIKRAIFGRETGEQGTRHLQGYVEFKRSVRLGRCREILPGAHWEKARGNAKENYEYCSKDGEFETFGDWENVLARRGNRSDEKENEFRDLLRCVYEDNEDDIKNSTKYVYRKRGIDERVLELRQQADARSRFDRVSTAMVSDWQLQILRRLFAQSARSVLWVADSRGGTGKTFLGHVLSACYGYDLFDGVTACRDIAWMLSKEVKGIVFDVTRSDSSHFSYQSLESCKNGFVMSGKYQGIKRMFKSVPVIVFANFMPDTSKLSEDRWDIVECDGVSEEEKVPKNKPEETWPFIVPKAIPFQEIPEVQVP